MPFSNTKPINKYYKGHRKRAKERLIKFGIETLRDYEIVELMLFLIFKRKDVKPLAKRLLNRFGTIDRILNATYQELTKIEGIGMSAFNAIKIINGIVIAAVKSRVIKKKHINCFEDVIAYCKLNMKYLVAEELRVLFLNAVSEIIADEVIQKGDLNTVSIYPRMIARRCIEIGANGVILVHNHPSGDPTPSSDDLYMTDKIYKALKTLDISLQDHIIIGDDRFISFKTLGILCGIG